MLFLEFAIYAGAALVVVGLFVYERFDRPRFMRELQAFNDALDREARALVAFQEALGGRTIRRGWTQVRTETSLAPGDDTEHPIYRFDAVARDLLPRWASFTWTSPGVLPTPETAHDRNEVVLLALFSPGELALIPGGLTLRGGNGDLTLETEDRLQHDDRPLHEHTQLLVDLGAAFLTRGEERAVERLRDLACSATPARWPALRVLTRRLPHHDATTAALAHARAAEDPLLRAIAAVADGAEGLPALRALAHDPAVTPDVLIEAIDGLLAADDLEGLVAISAAFPATRVQKVAEALGRRATAGATPLLVRLLDDPDPTRAEAVAMALARVGNRDAVEPLLHRLQRRGVGESLATSVRVAVELIQERAGGHSLRGGLTLVEAGPSAGQLSLAASRDGELALVPVKEREPEGRE